MILRAISLMILSMAFLAGADVFFKLGTQAAPIGQVMAMVSLGGTLAFAVVAYFLRIPLITRDLLHPMVMLRNLFEVIGGIGMVIGLAYVSLPVFAAIIQVGPLVVTLGAALFLKEQVGWRRWMAIAVGIIGMLMVIRPFGSGFTGWELFAVMGITGLSARDLITRLSPRHIPSLAISTWGFAATLLPGVVMWSLSTRPTSLEPDALWPILGAILVTTCGYMAITTAMRMAPASIVAPFRYTRLIFTTGLGILIFGDRPDGWTLAGSALILAAGLYGFMRERKLARAG